MNQFDQNLTTPNVNTMTEEVSLFELNNARAQLQTVYDSYSVYHGIQDLIDGSIVPGDSENIEVVGKSIRNNYPIPLKYTQSYASLQTLLEYAYEKGDTELAFWAEKQISHVLSPATMNSFKIDLQKRKIIPVRPKSNRKEFLKSYKKMSLPEILKFTYKEEKDSFWGHQLVRFHKANKARAKIKDNTPIERLKPLPFSETMKESFINEPNLKSNTILHPSKLIAMSKISPYVYIPALIEAHAPRGNWQGIFNNNSIKTGHLIKTLVIPKEIFLRLLNFHHVPLDNNAKKFLKIKDMKQEKKK